VRPRGGGIQWLQWKGDQSERDVTLLPAGLTPSKCFQSAIRGVNWKGGEILQPVGRVDKNAEAARGNALDRATVRTTLRSHMSVFKSYEVV
jgi:hypothetical protein